MQHLSTAFLITALAIVVNERVVDAQNVTSADQVAAETKTKPVTEPHGLKQEQVKPIQQKANQTNNTELRAPNKPPIHVTQDKRYYFEVPKQFYNPTQKLKALPVQHRYTKEQLQKMNSIYKYPNVIPTQRGIPRQYRNIPNRQTLVYAASSAKPIVRKPQKFSISIQTINGIRTDFVRPPHFVNSSTTTTSAPTTTQKILRTKRIWPKRILEKTNATSQNSTLTYYKYTGNSTLYSTDWSLASNHQRVKIVGSNTSFTTETPGITTRAYRRVTRTSKAKSTTPTNLNELEINDWVPALPSHFSKRTKRNVPETPKTSRRSDVFVDNRVQEPNMNNLLYLQTIPVGQTGRSHQRDSRKNLVFFRKKKRQPHNYVITSSEPAESRQKVIYAPPPPQFSYDNPQLPESYNQPSVVMKVKHHHHHHHHRYVKTVEKPVKVPYKVEVPKPYPVEKKVPVPMPVEKIKVVDRPYPVHVEKKVPYPVTVKVPQPIPVKVVEKEYVPKPFPIIHHVPIVKHVEVKVPQPVPVEVEKKVPYPVQVPVTVEKQVPYPVPVEKQIPYPVPIKVYVPQPYPVEKRVPYPVTVKEPVEIIKHVHVKVPVLRPYPVKVPQPIPITIEKKVPFPITVEKKVPFPVEVLVPHKIHIEKKVPIYVPKPYPVEKKVPFPVKVPYPVKVPVKVPVEVPVQVPVYIHHPFQILNHQALGGGGDGRYYGNVSSENPYYGDGGSGNPYYGEEEDGWIGRSGEKRVTSSPHHTVTVHGNTGYNDVISRSDSETTTAAITTAKP